MQSEYIVDVTETDFPVEVIQFSLKTPVMVDFWASWCQPCKTLSPILERLTKEAEGRFRLAKVDVDANPSLSMRFDIRGIPAVKGFRNGQVVAEFTGLLPEANIVKFLRDLAPGPGDLKLLKGQSLLGQNQWAEAEKNFRETLSVDPRESAALLGLAKSLLANDKAIEAVEILRNFPASREFSAAQRLAPLAAALQETKGYEGEEFMEAAYLRALDLVRKGNIPAALDGLLAIIRADKQYRSGMPRQIVLALLEILGEDNELTRQYRSELATALF